MTRRYLRPNSRRGPHVPDGENYREKALYCLMTADKARDQGVRLALLKLARNYVALADYLDSHGTVHPGDQAQDNQKDG
jgi:hypothetical protein